MLRGMWDLPRPGLEPVSPALAGRLSTTAPPGKPPMDYFEWRKIPRETGHFSEKAVVNFERDLPFDGK